MGKRGGEVLLYTLPRAIDEEKRGEKPRLWWLRVEVKGYWLGEEGLVEGPKVSRTARSD